MSKMRLKVHTFGAVRNQRLQVKGLAESGTKEESNIWQLYDDGVHVNQAKVSFVIQ